MNDARDYVNEYDEGLITVKSLNLITENITN